MLARHVSDLTGSSLGAFYKLYLQIWYVVIRELLGTSSRYEVVGNTEAGPAGGYLMPASLFFCGPMTASPPKIFLF